jgi:hypothetical protein
MLPLSPNKEIDYSKNRNYASSILKSRNSDRDKRDPLEKNSYSFLNKQDYTSQILNMGFSTSFKLNSPFLKGLNNSEKIEKEKTMSLINLYETSNATTRKKMCACITDCSYFYFFSSITLIKAFSSSIFKFFSIFSNFLNLNPLNL